MTDIGSMRHRLRIEAPSGTADGGGGQGADPWVAAIPVATVWGRVEPVRGAERLQAMRLASPVTHRIVIRYRPHIEPTMRIVFGTRVFNIRAVLNPGESNRRLELLCEEGVAV